MAGLYTALEKPVLIPLFYLTIALWPLAWPMNWMSYLNGSAHRSTHKTSFSGNETRGQLDFVAGFMPLGHPDVLARGMLGMIAYDATTILDQIEVPTLVVVGDRDTTTKPGSRRIYRAEYPPRNPGHALTGQAHGTARASRAIRPAGRRVRGVVPEDGSHPLNQHLPIDYRGEKVPVPTGPDLTGWRTSW